MARFRVMKSGLCRFAPLAIAASIAACSNDNPVAPGYAPVPPAPALACPADIVQNGITGLGRTIDYATPDVDGGHPPVSVSCTPPSGAAFPVGETLVTCLARDALEQVRTCSFRVTLTALQLTATRFVAFGDSVTAGENGFAPPCPAGARVNCIDLPNAYPTLLQQQLRGDFPSQTPTVVNAGVPGNHARDDVARLPSVLSQHRPDALLILHGFNDLGHQGEDVIAGVITALRDQIRIARGAGVRQVFVSTLLPPGPGFRARDPEPIETVNDALRRLVPAEGARLVDAYPLFLGRETTLIAPDGLHLLPEGNRVLADAFYAAIRATLTSAPARRRP